MGAVAVFWDFSGSGAPCAAAGGHGGGGAGAAPAAGLSDEQVFEASSGRRCERLHFRSPANSPQRTYTRAPFLLPPLGALL